MSKYLPSEEESKLYAIVNKNNSIEEIEMLLSFTDYPSLLGKLWSTHCDNYKFVDLWLQHYNEFIYREKKRTLEQILFTPIYDEERTYKMQCFHIQDVSGTIVEKEFVEMKEGEDFVPRNSSHIPDTKNRLNFHIDAFGISKDICIPRRRQEYMCLNNPYYKDYILDEMTFESLLKVPHYERIIITIKFASKNKKFDSLLRRKAVGLCNDNAMLEKMLYDFDGGVREIVLQKLTNGELEISKEQIYKMLESEDAHVRMQGIKLLKNFESLKQ